MTYTIVTLTGTFQQIDGTPAKGNITVTPTPSVVTDADGETILTGRSTTALDDTGSFSMGLPASDDPVLGQSVIYKVVAAMHHAYWSADEVVLPASAGTVDLASVADTARVEYITSAELEQAIEAALDGFLTLSPTPPDGGLWVDTSKEA